MQEQKRLERGDGKEARGCDPDLGKSLGGEESRGREVSCLENPVETARGMRRENESSSVTCPLNHREWRSERFGGQLPESYGLSVEV